jgi:hypothetical protein
MGGSKSASQITSGRIPTTANISGDDTLTLRANLEHTYALNCVQWRPTGLICTAVTGGFSVTAGHATLRTSLGAKRSSDLA